MRYGLTPVDYVLWVAAIVASSWLLSVLLRKDNRQSFQYFAIYVGASVVKSLVLWYTHFRAETTDYFFTYYSGQFLLAILSLLVMAELTRELLAPYNCLPRAACRDLTQYVCIAIMVSLIAALASHPQHYYAYILSLDKFLKFVSFGCIAVALWKVYEMGLPIAERCQKICAGWIFCTLVQAANSAFALSGRAARFTRPIGSIAYLVTLAIWIIAFSKAENVSVLNDEAVDVLQKKINASVGLIAESACINS